MSCAASIVIMRNEDLLALSNNTQSVRSLLENSIGSYACSTASPGSHDSRLALALALALAVALALGAPRQPPKAAKPRRVF